MKVRIYVAAKPGGQFVALGGHNLETGEIIGSKHVAEILDDEAHLYATCVVEADVPDAPPVVQGEVAA